MCPFHFSVLCKQGRTQLGSDGLSQVYLFSTVGVRHVPLKHMISREFRPDFNRFSPDFDQTVWNLVKREKNLQGQKSWAWLPKFCRTFGVLLQNLSSTGFLLCEPSCRTSKVPQNSGEPLGARTRLLRTGFFCSLQWGCAKGGALRHSCPYGSFSSSDLSQIMSILGSKQGT